MGSFQGPRPTRYLHGPCPSVKAPPLQGWRQSLRRESKRPGNARREGRETHSPSRAQPRGSGSSGRGDSEAQAVGAEWRPGLVSCPHQQGQSEYVTNRVQGGPGSLGWDRDWGAGARFLAWALCTLSGRSQRTEKSATQPVTYRELGPRGTRQRHHVTSVSRQGDSVQGSQGPP